MKVINNEPAGRRLTGEPLHWRRRLKPEWDFIPIASFRELDGVAWDCADCGTTGALVLRAMRYHRYFLRCRNCHRQTELNGIVAERIAIALGVPARRGSPPVIKAWVDEDGNPRASIDGKEHSLGTSAERAALEEERARES